MKKRRKGRRFTFSTSRQSSQHHLTELEPEDLAVYVRRAEKQVIPIIQERQLGPAVAQFLLAQQTLLLVTSDPRLTIESGMDMANRVLVLWQEGYYRPGSAYPFTLEETLQELQEVPKAKWNYEASFHPFTPVKYEKPCGLGQVAGGIVQHPETQLWQIWMMNEGPATFLAAYRDPGAAHRNLETIIQMSRKGGSEAEAELLYRQLRSQADGEPKELPYDMMLYLAQHLDHFTIML